MKTNRITLGTAVVAAIAALNITGNAAEPLLSPRAQANQIRTVPGVTKDRLDRGILFKHRGDFVFPSKVSGVNNDRDFVHERLKITISPRAAQTFPWLLTKAHGRKNTQKAGVARVAVKENNRSAEATGQ